MFFYYWRCKSRRGCFDRIALDLYGIDQCFRSSSIAKHDFILSASAHFMPKVEKSSALFSMKEKKVQDSPCLLLHNLNLVDLGKGRPRIAHFAFALESRIYLAASM